MEISVKVLKVLNALRFASQKTGNEYVKNFFVGETSGQFPKKICFAVLGEEKFNQMGIVVGKSYNVSFDVESREWKDKWFTECQAWKAVCLESAPSEQQVQVAANNNDGGAVDDMPF